MYRFHDACFGFMRMRYWCVSQLWRGRIKIVSAGVPIPMPRLYYYYPNILQ